MYADIEFCVTWVCASCHERLNWASKSGISGVGTLSQPVNMTLTQTQEKLKPSYSENCKISEKLGTINALSLRGSETLQQTFFWTQYVLVTLLLHLLFIWMKKFHVDEVKLSLSEQSFYSLVFVCLSGCGVDESAAWHEPSQVCVWGCTALLGTHFWSVPGSRLPPSALSQFQWCCGRGVARWWICAAATTSMTCEHCFSSILFFSAESTVHRPKTTTTATKIRRKKKKRNVQSFRANSCMK